MDGVQRKVSFKAGIYMERIFDIDKRMNGEFKRLYDIDHHTKDLAVKVFAAKTMLEREIDPKVAEIISLLRYDSHTVAGMRVEALIERGIVPTFWIKFEQDLKDFIRVCMVYK